MTRSLAILVLPVVVAMALSMVGIPSTPQPETAQEGMWHIYTVDSTGTAGMYTSIALDSNGYPHVSYGRLYNQYPWYARWTGTNWRVETIHANYAGFGCGQTTIAIDSKDQPHVGFYAGVDIAARYGERIGGNWSVELVNPGPNIWAGWGISLALDSVDNPHMSYAAGDESQRYAVKREGKWNVSILDQMGGPATSIALDSDDRPHVAYINDRLQYANWNGSNWNIEHVDSAWTVTASISMALDSSDSPHISFFDHSTYLGGLTVAERTDRWLFDRVEHPDPYTWMSLALDSGGEPHLSYWNSTSDDLMYARRTGGNWSIETVDSAGDVGEYNSIALDSQGNPHISYFDRTNGDLKYATKANLSPPEPRLSYSPASVDFDIMPPDARGNRTIEVWNSGGGALTYSLDMNVPWIAGINPAGGSGTGEHDAVTVSIDTTGLATGPHAGSISIASNGGNATVRVSVNVTAAARQIRLDIDPDTLNKKSRGRWMTAYLNVENASVWDIDTASLLLNDVVPPSWWDVQTDTTLMVKFDRAAVQGIVPVSDSVDIKVTGRWEDGGSFEVHDTIRVIDP